jgi:hypothetical protein
VFLPTSSKNGTYTPKLYAAAAVHFKERRRKVDQTRQVAFLVGFPTGVKTVDWDAAQPCLVMPAQLLKEAPVAAPYLPLPPNAMQVARFARWAKQFDRWLARTQRLEVTVTQDPLEVWTMSPARGGVSVELVAIAWDLG